MRVSVPETASWAKWASHLQECTASAMICEFLPEAGRSHRAQGVQFSNVRVCLLWNDVFQSKEHSCLGPHYHSNSTNCGLFLNKRSPCGWGQGRSRSRQLPINRIICEQEVAIPLSWKSSFLWLHIKSSSPCDTLQWNSQRTFILQEWWHQLI
jgi:hypothetical protein